MSHALIVEGIPGQAEPLRLDALRCVIGKDLDCEVTLPGWRVSQIGRAHV